MKYSEITISKIISFIGEKNYFLNSDESTKILNFNSLDIAKKGDMTFCSIKGIDGQNLINNSLATMIICHISLKSKIKNSKSNLIFVENPRYWFIRCMQNFLICKNLKGIHPTAIVQSKIPESVYVGPYSVVEKDVKIGDNTIIHNNVHIHENTSIGKNCIINSCSVLGSDGFGYERDNSRNIVMFPHVGGIILEDDVEIGANVCVDKGTMKNTIIGKGTKIDNLVHIAHNVKIGQNCSIVANSLIAGSCILGNNVHVAMSVTIRDRLSIGSNSIIGMGSVVTKNILKNSTVYGNPAKIIKKN